MSKINIRDFFNENEDGAPDLVGITTFSATSYFVPTRGTTAQRPSDHLEEGSLRYNYDTKNLEYYKGDTLGWSQFELIDPDLGGGTGSNQGVGTRGLIGGGTKLASPGQMDTIDFITVSTLGDAQDFGNLSAIRFGAAGSGSRTRAIYSGGYGVNIIEFNTYASLGNATDFGDRTIAAGYPASLSNQVRSVSLGGYVVPSVSNVIDYITISQTGNAVDFGDATAEKWMAAGCSSSTRGVASGSRGSAPNYPFSGTIDFFTIMTTGNAADFGDLSVTRGEAGACSSSTRGIIAGGGIGPASLFNTIDFITIASTGNATDFGDATTARRGANGLSSPTRGVFCGMIQTNSPGFFNTIDFVTIASTGDATDFGDLTDTARSFGGTCSNGHGGL